MIFIIQSENICSDEITLKVVFLGNYYAIENLCFFCYNTLIMLNLSKVKAIVFDVDGLMADTEYWHNESVKTMMKHKGIRLTNAYMAAMVGVSSTDNFLQMQKDFGLKGTLKKYLSDREKVYIELLKKSGIKGFPGLRGIFELARKKGLKLAVGSSSIKPQIKVSLSIILRSVGIKQSIWKFFDSVITGSDVKRTKPAPDIYLLVAQRISLKPSNCLVIEDSVSGVKAAKAAGMQCIAVKSRYSKKHDLSKANAIVASLKGALKLLKRMGNV